MPAVATLALLAATLTSASPSRSLLAVAEGNNGIMPFDTATYNKIVNAGAEEFRSDHSLIVLLTANRTPGVDCGPCKQFQPGYDEVATAWRRKAKGWSQGQAGHYFAQVEFNEGREIFQQVRSKALSAAT
jgi:thiol-disulfide isomerase/thioredoxin